MEKAKVPALEADPLDAKLKPCPFCANAIRNELTHVNGLSVVGCDQCGAQGPTSWSELFAKRKWNQRGIA
jgi:hypothetical protein